MAKTEHNIVIQGLSGVLGDQLIVRHFADGRTVVGKKPTFPDNRAFTEKQKGHLSAFKEASAYAKQAAKSETIYAEKALGTSKTAYNVAVADWFHPPEIEEIDLSGWMGQPGEPIRIRAVDDVKVVRVMVLIAGDGDGLIEQGEAERVDELWWTYTATQAVSGEAKVIAVAWDLAGHMGQGVQLRETAQAPVV